MKTARTAGLAMACALLSLATALGFGLQDGRAGSSTQASAGSWEQSLRDCLKLANDDAVDECTYQVMVQAVDAGQMREVNLALKPIMDEDKGYIGTCHGAGHRAGQYAWNKYKDLEGLLQQVEEPVCSYGLGHGVLDGMADSDPTEENFAKAAAACQSYWNGEDQNPDPAYVYCADGTGHASYWATRDPVKAAELCALHEERKTKRECVGGVMMEMFEPAGFLTVTEPDYPLENAFDVVSKTCKDIAALNDEGLLDGCWAGSGYVLTRVAWNAGDEYRADPTDAKLNKAISMWSAAVKDCERAFKQEHAPCSEMAMYQMHYYLREKHEDKACKELKEELFTPCLRSRATIV